jgi:hypothetical protein
MEEKIFKSNVLQWAKNYPEVERWLGHVQKREENAYCLYRFCEWAGKNPTELLALKDDPASKDAEKLLDDFCTGEVPSFTNSLKYIVSIAVKSFFRWNYRDLAKASGIVSLEKVKPYNALTKEGLRKLWNRAFNLRDKALITFVNSTAIAKETLTHLTWGHLEADWQNKDLPCVNIESEILKGHGRGKYKGVRQITFLTSEAKRDLINYKEWMESPQKLGRKLTLQDHIWLETCKPYRPISYDTFGKLITTLSENAGVSFSWHDARRWVNTALEGISISVNWARKIRGRKVRGEESPYSQPAIEQLRAKFAEAVSLLQFTGTEKESLGPEDTRREIAISQLRALGFSEDKLEFIRGHLRTGEETIEDLERTVQEETATFRGIVIKTKREKNLEKEKDCSDGEHCQKICGESELGPLLEAGWHVVTALPSGKIVIER